MNFCFSIPRLGCELRIWTGDFSSLPAVTESSVRGSIGGDGTSLLRNGLYNIGGQTVRGAVSLLAVPFPIRFLGLREYGVWSLAYAVFALMTMSEAGISITA